MIFGYQEMNRWICQDLYKWERAREFGFWLEKVRECQVELNKYHIRIPFGELRNDNDLCYFVPKNNIGRELYLSRQPYCMGISYFDHIYSFFHGEVLRNDIGDAIQIPKKYYYSNGSRLNSYKFMFENSCSFY